MEVHQPGGHQAAPGVEDRGPPWGLEALADRHHHSVGHRHVGPPACRRGAGVMAVAVRAGAREHTTGEHRGVEDRAAA